jgi:hypothetical protein
MTKADYDALVAAEIEIIKQLQGDAGNVNYAERCATAIESHVRVLRDLDNVSIEG